MYNVLTNDRLKRALNHKILRDPEKTRGTYMKYLKKYRAVHRWGAGSTCTVCDARQGGLCFLAFAGLVYRTFNIVYLMLYDPILLCRFFLLKLLSS